MKNKTQIKTNKSKTYKIRNPKMNKFNDMTKAYLQKNI